MIDFPITDLLSDAECVTWLEAFLHPEGLVCPRCGSPERRQFREQGHFPAYRCLVCNGYDTLLTDTVFEKTHQRPATLVLLLRGIAKGESSARLSRELGIGRKRVMELRQKIQNNLYETLPTAVMEGKTFEADGVYQNAGEKGTPHPDPNDPPRSRANKARGRGTYDNDRPPIIGAICRETGEYRYWVVEHADKATSQEIIRANIPPKGTLLFTDEATNFTGLHAHHATVCHAIHEWARDDDGDGLREVHCNTCEGLGAALRTYLRVFRGVHKYYLAEYVATFETLLNAKAISPAVVRRMCFGDRLRSTSS